MAKLNWSNTAVITNLSSAINDTAPSLTVNDATGYPAANFKIWVDEEVILVGSRSGTSFSSLTRGHDGTTPASHGSGAAVRHVTTAEDFQTRFIGFPIPSPAVGQDGYLLQYDHTNLEFDWVPTSSVGETDHGALSGLGDDDHTQYHTDARALTWLGTRSTTDLSEGANLYYTDARADARIALADLSDLATRPHSALTGLGDDDHPQYLLVDGTRSMAGQLNMASYVITSPGTPTDDLHVGSRSYNDLRYLAIAGTAAAATKLETARNFDLTGDVTTTGAVAFDGTSNVTLNTVVANDSHTHDTRYYTETESDARYAAIADGVTGGDHGNLVGLGDDDHTQYHTDARALTWLSGRSTSDLPEGTRLYYTNARADARISNAALSDIGDINLTSIGAGELIVWSGSAWLNNTLSEAGIAAASHTHAHSDLTGIGASDHHTKYTDSEAVSAVAATDTYLLTSGDTMTGILDMGTHKIIGVVDPTSNQDAATKKYVDDNAGGTEHTVSTTEPSSPNIGDVWVDPSAGGTADQDILEHTASGLTAGEVLTATGATTFGWTQLAHSSLSGITANAHHNQVHALTGSDHTETGLTTGHILTATSSTTFEWQAPPAGVTDHGALTGLGDDDHTQYFNTTRGDARYLTLTGGTLTGSLTVGTLMVPAASSFHIYDPESEKYRFVMRSSTYTTPNDFFFNNGAGTAIMTWDDSLGTMYFAGTGVDISGTLDVSDTAYFSSTVSLGNTTARGYIDFDGTGTGHEIRWDSDTGIYSTGDGNITLRTNNQTQMSVGTGGTTIYDTLIVTGNTQIQGSNLYSDGDWYIRRSSSSDGDYYFLDADYHRWYINGAEVFRVNASGDLSLAGSIIYFDTIQGNDYIQMPESSNYFRVVLDGTEFFRVATNSEVLTRHIRPWTDSSYDLGNTTYWFRHVYTDAINVSGRYIHFGTQTDNNDTIEHNDTSDTFFFVSDTDTAHKVNIQRTNYIDANESTARFNGTTGLPTSSAASYTVYTRNDAANWSELYRYSSSARYKQDIYDYEAENRKASEFIMALRPVVYRDKVEASSYNSTTRRGRVEVGLIAEEVAEVEPWPQMFTTYRYVWPEGTEPELAHLESDVKFVDAEPDTVKYTNIVMPLIVVIQQHERRISTLEERIARLEAAL